MTLPHFSDERLQSFLEEEIPRHLQDSDAIRPLRQRLADIIGQRKVAVLSREQAERNLDGLWTGFFPLEAQRIDFRAFMADCRGPQDPANAEAAGEITLACSAAWEARQQAEQGTVWQTLSETIPPGILLLFLLGTLSGLYRYNLRLAGFHDARADALELLSLGRGEAEIRQALDGSADGDPLSRIAAALAADKVAFSAARDPTDQAVDLAKGLLAQK